MHCGRLVTTLTTMVSYDTRIQWKSVLRSHVIHPSIHPAWQADGVAGFFLAPHRIDIKIIFNKGVCHTVALPIYI
jgi:hypothetical protein